MEKSHPLFEEEDVSNLFASFLFFHFKFASL